jgi:hypothetical protein
MRAAFVSLPLTLAISASSLAAKDEKVLAGARD